MHINISLRDFFHLFFTRITVPKYVMAIEMLPILEFPYDYNIWLVQSCFTLNTKCKNQQ